MSHHEPEEFDGWFERKLQSLSQQSWKVELEMDYHTNCCISKEGKTMMNKGCMERNRCGQPKLTDGKIKILKLL
jgi:hypothetical protein